MQTASEGESRDTGKAREQTIVRQGLVVLNSFFHDDISAESVIVPAAFVNSVRVLLLSYTFL